MKKPKESSHKSKGVSEKIEQVQSEPMAPVATEVVSEDASERDEEKWKEKYIRLYAEFENNKKRVVRERNQWHFMAHKELFVELISTLDDLKRAIESTQQSKELKQDRGQGLSLILENLEKVLLQRGLNPIEVKVGEEPNPQEHHVLTQSPTTNQDLKGRIIEVIMPGYRLHNHVLRAAQVIIGA